MHLLPMFVSRISVCTFMVQRIRLQSSDKYVHYQKRIRHPKISGIKGITSVLHWSKSKNSTNPRCYFGGHLGFGIKMTPNDNFNTRNGFVAIELVGLEVLL